MSNTINYVLLVISGSFVLSILTKATITTALVLICTRLMRRSRASVRHVVLAAGFAVLMVLPIASVVIPSVSIAVPTVEEDDHSLSAAEPTINTAVATIPDTNIDVTPVPPPWWKTVSLFTLLLTTWIVGSIGFLLPVVIGLWEMRSLRRRACRWQEVQPLLNRLATERGIRRQVEVQANETVPGPMTCGVVNPTIMLPLDAKTWPEEDLDRAIIHELEHVCRWDWLSRSAARAICAFYWFHPLVWIAWWQFALEAERACDDAVLANADPTAYADQLVVLAQHLSSVKQSVLGMANRSDLATRVAAVLDIRQRRGRAGRTWIALACLGSALLVATVSPLELITAPQTSSSQPKMPLLRFEVVSIKPSNPEQRQSRALQLLPGGRFSARGIQIPILIAEAYKGVRVVPSPELHKTTDQSIEREQYDIEAVAEKDAIAPGTPAKVRDEKIRLMLQNLLVERFKLAVHRETTEQPIYAMMVAKGGPKLQKASKEETDCVGAATSLGDPHSCHVFLGGMGRGLNGQAVDMADLATALLGYSDRPIINETGLTGLYTIETDGWLPLRERPVRPDGAQPNPEDSAFADPSRPTLLMVLDRLGLKLESQKATVQIVVIDHVEKPTAN